MITIVDFGMGNLGSTLNMLKKIGVKSIVSADSEKILQATKIILPGVGAFDQGMKNLRERNLIDLLRKKVVDEGTPCLGICLGMQLFSAESAEGHEKGLGWIDAVTVKFDFSKIANPHLKIPHMGWNTVTPPNSSSVDPLLAGFSAEKRFYFVHSFHLQCHQSENILGLTHHGYDFPSVIRHRNIFGTQFHPEKSHRFGMQLFKNFTEVPGVQC